MQTTKPEQQSHPDLLRRRLFRGVYGGVGVLMAVQAKTALGAACASPSAILSGNTSPRPGTGTTCSGGRSPGFWKVPQKFNYWTGAIPATFNPNVSISVCVYGMQNLSLSDIKTQGTLLTNIFTGAPTGVGLWAVLAFPNAFLNGMLLRHLSAAYLNANFSWPGGVYPLSTTQIVEMWMATKGGGLYCPSSMTCAPNTRWNAADVIKYISDMYDISADVGADPDLCKKST